MYITGTHAIEESLEKVPKGSVLYVSTSAKHLASLVQRAKATRGIVVKKVLREALDEMSTDHQGAVLYTTEGLFIQSQNTKVNLKSFLSNITDDDKTPYIVLLLDGITDPHNLGAILRSCDKFNVSLVVLPPSRTASINETVMRVSSGAASYVKVSEGENLNRAIEMLKQKNFWIFASDIEGEPLSTVKFPLRTCIIMGSEGSGLHPLVKKNADYTITIETGGHIDSLNVSVATGIVLYSVSRHQNGNN